MTDFDELMRIVKTMQSELLELRTRHSNMLREGVVEKVDAKKGYKVSFGKDENGRPIDSAWFPHPEQGGAFKTWRPSTKGQIVYVASLGGDQRTAFIVPKGGFSDQNPAPSDKLDENVETYGKVKTTWKAGSTEKKIGDTVSITTTDKDRVTKTEKVTVAQMPDSHLVDAGAKHLVAAAKVVSEVGGVKHLVDQAKVLADAPLFRAVKKVILASG